MSLSNNNTQDFYVELIRTRGSNPSLTLQDVLAQIKDGTLEYKAFGLSKQIADTMAEKAFKLRSVGKLGTSISTTDTESINSLRDAEGELIWKKENVNGQEEVHTTLTVQTGLSSVKLGFQHRQSASPENILFTNLSSKTHWFPTWQGIKDASVKDEFGAYKNHGVSGIISPEARIYDESLTTIPFANTEVFPYEYIPYTLTSTFLSPTSGQGIQFRTGQALNVGDILTWEIVNNDTGITVFNSSQALTEAYSIGDMVTFWYSQPAEIHDGVVTVEMKLQRGIGGIHEPFLVSKDIDGRPYDLGSFRGFKGVNLALNEILKVSASQPIYYETTYAVDTTAGEVVLTLNLDADVVAFKLFDNAKKFNVNSCKVVIGTDTYELDKKNKSYQFFKDNGSWCVTEQSIKVVV